jgi:hypothetical protein
MQLLNIPLSGGDPAIDTEVLAVPASPPREVTAAGPSQERRRIRCKMCR